MKTAITLATLGIMTAQAFVFHQMQERNEQFQNIRQLHTQIKAIQVNRMTYFATACAKIDLLIYRQ